MWQELREELHPKGLEVVTVGLEAAGPEPCRPYIEAAQPTHPSLIDRRHIVSEMFGIVNIPMGVWIDEHGVIVRPAEPAHVRVVDRRPPNPDAMAAMPERMRDIMLEAAKIETDAEQYLTALRDWVEHGAKSRYALEPDAVVARSRPRNRAIAEAAAHFELAEALIERGDDAGAVLHFREAHRLDPDNFSYKRQAWSLASPGTGPFERFWQGPVEGQEWPYDSDWLSEVRAKGAERYYDRLEM